MDARFLLQKASILSLVLCCSLTQAATQLCTVDYSTRNDWANGFVVDIVITNTSTNPVTNWKVDWKYNVPVSLANKPWRADIKINDTTVVATPDKPQNATIAAGQKLKFGLPISYNGNIKPLQKNVTVACEK